MGKLAGLYRKWWFTLSGSNSDGRRSMSLLRAAHSPTASGSSTPQAISRPCLRVFASGTLFLTHKLLVSLFPEPGGVTRAQRVESNRGGHGANVLSVLAQFRASRHPGVNAGLVPSSKSVSDVYFCGPLAGSEEGTLVINELEAQGVATVFSIIREGKGVPTAWIIESGDGTKTVINHNPLPDMTHEEFISRLGPILAPENYDIPTNPLTSHQAHTFIPAHTRTRSGSGPHTYGLPPNGHVSSGTPPFDWMHFEARAPQITLSNLTGLEGLARERGWRSRCVFSLEVGRPGVESLIRHADVIFFSKPYAQIVSPTASPRSFLVSMSAHASSHALLIADWGAQGAALLSVPTREYLQSSGWVEPHVSAPEPAPLGSVRTGSGFWADGRPNSNVAYTDSEKSQWLGSGTPVTLTEELAHSHLDAEGRLNSHSDTRDRSHSQTDPARPRVVEDSDSRRTSLETERGVEPVVDEVGAHEAFVAGMIFALSQKILPGGPYIKEEIVKSGGGDGKQQMPGRGTGADVLPSNSAPGTGRWKLEECLRFATELAGRKGRRTGFAGLRQEMEKSGWVVE